MKKVTRIISALISAYFITAGAECFKTEAFSPLLIGDLNRDGRVSMSDAVIMENYMIGRYGLNATQMIAADVNQDGKVDVLDKCLIQDIIINSRNKLPYGTWIGDRIGAKRYFCFGSGAGYIVYPDGKSYDFIVGSDEDIVALTMNQSGEEKTAFITWSNDGTFTLKWDNGEVEWFRSSSEFCFMPENMLNGNWVTDRGRTFSIEGLSGKLTEKNGEISRFEYFPCGNDITFRLGSTDNVKECTIKKNDSMHFTATWSDGSTERFTRQEIEVRNGITYVNGILIANKTYSLPSSYAPGKILPEAQSAFDAMAADALKQGISLKIVSGYRSYDYQNTLYNNYVARDGKAAADTYSARAGHSEHQTGLAMDINNASSGFNNTKEAKWLAENCVKYGFIIRYPKGKENITGYQYESWHVRYLGKELAKEVSDSGLTLEEFLCIDSKYK